MKPLRIILLSIISFAVVSCGTIRNSAMRTEQTADIQDKPVSRPKILVPEDGEPIVDDSRGTGSTTGRHKSGTAGRPTIIFSEAESSHVRTKGMFNMPEEGINLDLDDLASEFCYPYNGKFISDYGMRGKSFHTGVDIKAIPNDTIRAVLPGVVRMSKMYSSYGNIVVIRHYCGIETVYSHNSSNLVRVNDVVEAGTPIALAGRTGRATTEHLHFEVRAAGEHIDPKMLLNCTQMCMQSGKLYMRNINGIVVAATSEDELNEKYRMAYEISIAEATKQTEADNNSRQAVTDDSNTVYHRVVRGDTLSAIARQYGTSVKKICDLNNIKQTTLLQINQRLRVK